MTFPHHDPEYDWKDEGLFQPAPDATNKLTDKDIYDLAEEAMGKDQIPPYETFVCERKELIEFARLVERATGKNKP